MKVFGRIIETYIGMSIVLYHCFRNNVICANSSKILNNEKLLHAITTTEDDRKCTKRFKNETVNNSLTKSHSKSNQIIENSDLLSITTIKEDNEIVVSLFEGQALFVLFRKLRVIIASFAKILSEVNFNDNWVGSEIYLQTKFLNDEFLKCLKEISTEAYLNHKNWLILYTSHLAITMNSISDIIETKFELENKIYEIKIKGTSDYRLNKKLHYITEIFDNLVEFYVYSIDIRAELSNSFFNLLHLLYNVIEVVTRNPIDENINSLEKFANVKKKLFDIFFMFDGSLQDSFCELFKFTKISELKANKNLSTTNCRGVRLYG